MKEYKEYISKLLKNKQLVKWFIVLKVLKTVGTIAVVFSLNSCIDTDYEVISKDKIVRIPTNSNFNSLLDSIKPYLNDEALFIKYAKSEKLDKHVKSGRYDLKKGMSLKEVVGKLLKGEQSQQKIVIKNHQTIYKMASYLSKQIEADSASLVKTILAFPYNDSLENTDENVKQYFFPDTYFVWWNITPEGFVKRMKRQYEKFWSDERKQKAKKLGLSILEVQTLASIVQLEASVSIEEQKMVAKAYLNRIEKDIKLQADPTAVYGYNKAKGFSTVYRVYNFHTKYDSKYNTYLYTGLPPSPICLPNSSTIDAVLEPAKHDFIFFCAKADNSGTHHFTNSYADHQKNAKNYHKWLNSRNIN